jgi:hypothetical protein
MPEHGVCVLAIMSTPVSSLSQQVPLSDAFAVIDITIDVALVALPVALVWNLHMQRHEKVIVSLAFTFRLK